ncbi:hypothetical protein [Streptomyces antimycoticus]|nr:hypothetical protein [Streptomyces antimycoticus]
MRVALAAYDQKLARDEHLAPLIRHRLNARRQEIVDFLAATAGMSDQPDHEAS